MILNRVVCTFLLSVAVYFTPPSLAADLRIRVVDSQQLAIADAAVELMSDAIPATAAGEHYEMSQKNRTFTPFVLAVVKGSLVDFPNLDRTRHHVYSFSEAKPFELKLYVGKAEAPILFDKPGLVALGCNIHDYMQAFIYVANSPMVAVTDENGEVHFTNVSPGQYRIKLWHPWQKEVAKPSELSVTTAAQTLTLAMDIERQAKPSAPPSGFGQFDVK